MAHGPKGVATIAIRSCCIIGDTIDAVYMCCGMTLGRLTLADIVRYVAFINHDVISLAGLVVDSLFDRAIGYTGSIVAVTMSVTRSSLRYKRWREKRRTQNMYTEVRLEKTISRNKAR